VLGQVANQAVHVPVFGAVDQVAALLLNADKAGVGKLFQMEGQRVAGHVELVGEHAGGQSFRAGDDPVFTLSQVALNDTIMVFAFAPVVGLLLGLSSISVPWATLLVSVALYIVIPVIVAQVWRRALLRRGQATFDAALARIGPLSIAALLLTLVLLFAFQGQAILQQPLVIAMLAVPILIQVFFNSGLAYWLNRQAGEQHAIACPSALIGASNFFELAVAAAISLFGFHSGAALATVVGVLIEVPVMLLVVRLVNRSRGWYERGHSTT
jgi:arsenite transporter